MGRIILQKEITGSSVYTGGYINDYQDSIQLMTCNNFTAEQMHVLFSEKKLIISKEQYVVTYKLIDDGKEECHYCDDSCTDIFYTEFDNTEVSVFINEDATLELYITEQGKELKKTILMRYCPFCGRRLRG